LSIKKRVKIHEIIPILNGLPAGADSKTIQFNFRAACPVTCESYVTRVRGEHHMSKVFLATIKDSIDEALSCVLQSAGIAENVKGKSVLIKPNLFEPVSYTTGQTTNPALVKAAVHWCQQQGAQEVIVGEGPSYFTPADALRKCFTKTGIADVVEQCGAQWILFDEHHYRTYRDISPFLPQVFRISEHAFLYDIIINLPVPKTHYLTTVSIGMKNLKGFLKQEDKPLFHRVDLNRAVVELNKIITPFINLVDFTTSPHHRSGFILAGSDIVAADSVSTALMGLNPHEIQTLTLGSQAGLGEIHLAKIEIIGEDIKGLTMHYELPSAWLKKQFPHLTIIGHDTACSGCTIPLFSSLSQLADQAKTFTRPLTIMLGTATRSDEPHDFLVIGDCSPHKSENCPQVRGCPPSKHEILKALSEHVADTC
jgi:uncharacterized protein (DUF362 family)